MLSPHRIPSPLRRTAVALTTGLVLLGLLATPATADTTAPATTAGAAISSTAPEGAFVLHVEEGAPANSLTNGTPEHPFPTIEWAMALGQWLRKYGYSVHIVVGPGTYRENIVVGAAGPNPPLVIESKVPGAAVVSGADVESRWTPVDEDGLTTAPWDQDWGLAAVPSSWGVGVPEGVLRREAVFIDGQPVVQVLSEDALVDNTFYVDEAGDRLVLNPPADVTDLADHEIEVARRAHALRIKGLAGSVVVKGFVFEGAAAPFQQQMASITDSTNVVIEGNAFLDSSWGGIGLASTSGVTVRRNYIADNGGTGFNTYRTSDALVERNFIAGNNVRGARHGFFGWAVAGSKHFLLSDTTFRGNAYLGNLTRGLWIDTSGSDIRLEGDRICGNYGDGLFIEASHGPVTIDDATSCNNFGGGVTLANSGDVTIENSTLSDNVYGQLVFKGRTVRSWIDHLTGARMELPYFSDLTLTDNIVTSTGAARLIYAPSIPLEEWTEMLRGGEIVASDNTWTRPVMDGAFKIQASNFSMAQWDGMTGNTK